MTEFSKIWDTEVKQLAKACMTDPEFVRIIWKNQYDKLTQEEEEYLKSISEKYKDPYGMFYISHMIWRIEHDLADGRLPMARLAAAEVYEVLNDPGYFQNLFEVNENDEEWKTRAALRDGLCKLIHSRIS